MDNTQDYDGRDRASIQDKQSRAEGRLFAECQTSLHSRAVERPQMN